MGERRATFQRHRSFFEQNAAINGPVTPRSSPQPWHWIRSDQLKTHRPRLTTTVASVVSEPPELLRHCYSAPISPISSTTTSHDSIPSPRQISLSEGHSPINSLDSSDKIISSDSIKSNDKLISNNAIKSSDSLTRINQFGLFNKKRPIRSGRELRRCVSRYRLRFSNERKHLLEERALRAAETAGLVAKHVADLEECLNKMSREDLENQYRAQRLKIDTMHGTYTNLAKVYETTLEETNTLYVNLKELADRMDAERKPSLFEALQSVGKQMFIALQGKVGDDHSPANSPREIESAPPAGTIEFFPAVESIISTIAHQISSTFEPIPNPSYFENDLLLGAGDMIHLSSSITNKNGKDSSDNSSESSLSKKCPPPEIFMLNPKDEAIEGTQETSTNDPTAWLSSDFMMSSSSSPSSYNNNNLVSPVTASLADESPKNTEGFIVLDVTVTWSDGSRNPLKFTVSAEDTISESVEKATTKMKLNMEEKNALVERLKAAEDDATRYPTSVDIEL